MESVLFFSRLLVDAETRYWPMELEVAGLIWVIEKIRHMIEASEQPVISIHGSLLYSEHQSSE